MSESLKSAVIEYPEGSKELTDHAVNSHLVPFRVSVPTPSAVRSPFGPQPLTTKTINPNRIMTVKNLLLLRILNLLFPMGRIQLFSTNNRLLWG